MNAGPSGSTHSPPFLLAVTALSIPAFAADAPLAAAQNLSDFIFSLIRAVGQFLPGYGILTIAGSIVITFAKEILTLITG